MTISLFTGMNKAVRSLQTAQYAMGVHGSNIAHANDPAYTRRDVLPHSPSRLGGPAISRLRDAFVDEQYRRASGRLGDAEVRQNVLSKVEGIFGDPVEGGLRKAIDQFYDAWHGLSEMPSDGVARMQVIASGMSFAQQVGEAYHQLTSVEQTVNEQLTSRTGEVNEILQQVFELNKRVAELTRNKMEDADVRDQRDALLDKLGELTGATALEQPDGTVRVIVGSTPVVDGPTVLKLKLIDSEAGPVPTWDTFYTPSYEGSGTIGGLVRVRDTELAQLKQEIDKLGRAVAEQVNSLHGDPPFFVVGPGKADIAVNPGLQPADLKAGTTGSPGDGTLARRIALAGEQPILEATIMPGQVQSARIFYRNLVGWVGSVTRAAAQAGDIAQTHRQVSEQQRQAQAGVSLDEEVANLQMQQRAFQAASRVVTVMDEMLDHLINRTGR